MGAAGTRTKLHCDVVNSFSWSANVCGSKRWRFLPAAETSLLRDVFGEDVASSFGPSSSEYPRRGKARPGVPAHRRELLASLPLFQGLSNGEILQIATQLEAVAYDDGRTIMRQGDLGDCMYIVDKGTAAVRVKGVGEVAQLAEREYFGEQALLNSAPRTATVVATSHCRCFSLSRALFEQLVLEMMEPMKQIELNKGDD